MMQVSIGSNYSDDDSTHESGSRERRGGRQESGPREDNEGERRQERIGGESTFVISEPFKEVLLPDSETLMQ